MSQQTQSQQLADPKEPQRIVYDRIEQGVASVTGIASLRDSNGAGAFEFRVTGQMETIQRYAQEALIEKIALARLDDDGKQFRESLQAAALDARRQVWLERVRQLQTLVEKADYDLLGDEDRLIRQWLGERKERIPVEQKFDPKYDRLIEIVPVGHRTRGVYHLWLQLQSESVPRGLKDVYVPRGQRDSACTSASITTIDGDPDLYLYRSNDPTGPKAWSLRAEGLDEFVSSCVGNGDWEVHVVGYSRARFNLQHYTISTNWILTEDDVR